MILGKRKKKAQVEAILSALKQIEVFVMHDKDRVELAPKIEMSDEELKEIYDKVSAIATLLEEKYAQTQSIHNEMLEVVKKISEGKLGETTVTQGDAVDPHHAFIANSLNAVSIKLKKDFNAMISVLQEYQKGIYQKSLDENLMKEGEIKELICGINALKDAITSMFQKSFRCGLELEKASDTLMEKMYHILEASGEQSEQLNKASEMILHITEKVQQSEENTKKMQGSSQKVKDSTQEGLSYTTKTVQAMEEINEATQAINEAIDVVEQISFQTNILSLNAAVEAATAGEAGKGFAVVAQEVRNLAARSADAAKQIKELVVVATQKADEGKSISAHMSKGYEALRENIDQTISLIEDTTQSVSEQVESIHELEKTIDGLNAKTDSYISTAHVANEEAATVSDISSSIVQSVKTVEFEGKAEILTQCNTKKEKMEMSNV